MRTRILKTATALAFALGALVTVGAGEAEAASTYQGCPPGYVCIYPNASWNNGNPSHFYFRYGAHNLSNQFGVKRVFNNQTGGAKVRFCTGYNGTGCGAPLNAWTYTDINLTPINSIFLQP